jgi:Reverse transcriptase (RNA-dependent DNA polymerase)
VRQGFVLSPFLFAVYLDDLIDRRIDGRFCYIVRYADDILLISSSVEELQTLLHTCEHELKWLDMTINVNKSFCMRIGSRFDTRCCEISTMNGHSLPWVNEMRYLGIFMIGSRVFSSSFDHAKRAYYRSLNAVFGKLVRFASEEVFLQLVESKCLPIIMYGTLFVTRKASFLDRYGSCNNNLCERF